MTTRNGLRVSKRPRSRAFLVWAALAWAFAVGGTPVLAASRDEAPAVAPDSVAIPTADSMAVPAAESGAVRVAVPDSTSAPDVTVAADSTAAPDSTSTPVFTSAPDSVSIPGPPAGFLSVRSIPSGLAVLVDSLAAGRTPIDSLPLPPGSYLVRVLEPDPRRFDPAIDAVRIALHHDAAVSVLIDLRPSTLLRSTPEPSSVFLTARASEASDSLLGTTPLRVRPSVIEAAKLRFAHVGYADTTLAGASFIADSAAVTRVRLRAGLALAAPPPSIGEGAPVYRKGWFQWTLIGLGAALSGAAVVFHHQGDEAYDRYLESSNISEIPGLYDDVVRYDRYAAASLAVGQVCFVTGFVLLVTGQR
ncbi:MAG: PEGA domain-containing protein [Candidatus Eiseniibacteriota bacterium]